MANHAYVTHCKKPITFEKVRELTRKFWSETLKEAFEFVITCGYTDKDILLVLDDYNGLHLWVSEYVDEWEWDEDEPKHTIPSIEFRHGHSSGLMWWADLELENYLARELEGQVIDDSDGIPNDPRPPMTLGQYLKEYPGFDDWVQEQLDKFPQVKVLLDEAGAGHWEYKGMDGKWHRCVDPHYDPVTDLSLSCEEVGETPEHRYVRD